MEHTSFETLLKAEEAKLCGSLRADDMIDGSRAQSVERLNTALSDILLQYNAASSGDRVRQAAADCAAASARDGFGFLLAGAVREEKEKKTFPFGALVALLVSVICALAAALLIRRFFPVGCVLIAGSVFLAFLSGRLWHGEQKITVRPGLETDVIWKTLDRTAATMDRKVDELCAQIESWESEAASAHTGGNAQTDPEELKLFADLLEAQYSENGEYALRQLKKIAPFLRRRGIDTMDFSAEHAEFFELLPTKNEPSTQRPALVSGDALLLAGRATEHVKGARETGRV